MADRIHHCSVDTVEWFENLPEDIDISYGALIGGFNDENVVKREGDPVWFLEVSGGEYRGPIRFCPFCGERLPEYLLMNSWWAKQEWPCYCQGDDPIIHTHYSDEPHFCARCLDCHAYRPRIPEDAAIRILLGPE